MAQNNVILMPKLGLTMTEGMLAEWAVNPGQSVEAGELMFVVETDKVATEIAAPSAGTLIEILVQQGQTVAVGTPVARWTGEGQAVSEDASESSTGGVHAGTSAGASAGASDAARSAPGSTPDGSSDQASSQTSAPLARIIATPLARRLANQASLDLHRVAGSGPNGRIKASDVRLAIDCAVSAAPVDPVRSASAPEPVTQGRAGTAAGTQVQASGIVQAMARRMVQAKQEVPHFYLSTEANVGELLQLRERMNASGTGGNAPAVKLTVNHFLIAAVAHALKACPWQNRIWSGDGIVAFDAADIGIAVSTEKGLMAPVLKGLDAVALDTLAIRSNALIERVRRGQATREDLTGGAITISNAGMFNVTYMTPIINAPQSAILGVGSVRDVFRPDAAGQPVLQREMGLVLACDHRLHDGTSGLKFLNVVVELLQNPYQLLRSIPAAASY